MNTCTKCNRRVSHSVCDRCRTSAYVEDDSSFLASVVIGALTDDPLTGALAGGDILGGIIGASLDSLFD